MARGATRGRERRLQRPRLESVPRPRAALPPARSGLGLLVHAARGLDAARRFSDALDVFTRMTHLGDVRSLILHPASTTHTGRTREQLEAAGIGPGLLRLSIGIEDLEDLLADLEQGLRAAAPHPLQLAEAS
ncbi:PLP-dependent transferase [Rathayibacter oskolensis]|uniref:PLP-dependent transferase n=1 Tax=Rathayibacter oskolensis TaxID=1891671 RepID=UPI0034670056